MRIIKNCSVAGAAIFGLSLAALAPQGAQAADDAELAAKLANPIASLISVPFQLNYDQGFGPGNGQKALMNVQPVVPFNLTDDLTLVTRTIVPVAWQNDIAAGSGNQFGLGDSLQSFFLVPTPQSTSLGQVTFGVGPAVTWPTSTDSLLGPGKWGAGPTGVLIVQKKLGAGTLTWGGIANQQWGVADTRSGTPDLNSTFLQPVIAYTTDDAWTYSLNTEASYNWTSSDWSVPINASVSKVVSLGEQKIQLQAGAGYWAVSPEDGPEGLRGRLAVTFLFPE